MSIKYNKIICSNCKNAIPTDSDFCQFCGNIIHPAPHIEQQETLQLIDKDNTKRKRISFWLWIGLIAFNTLVVLTALLVCTNVLYDYVFEKALIIWRYQNIDPSYSYGYSSTSAYLNAIGSTNDGITFFAIIFIALVLLLIALSIVHSYIFRKKLRVESKKIRNLPWLCTLIFTVLFCIALSFWGVSEYNDYISYYQRCVDEEHSEMVIQAQATAMLKSTQTAVSTDAILLYAQRYPQKLEGTMLKIKGYVSYTGGGYNTYNSYIVMDDNIAGIYLEIEYGNFDENKPRLIEGDQAIIVGQVTSWTSGCLTIEMYDWKIID